MSAITSSGKKKTFPFSGSHYTTPEELEERKKLKNIRKAINASVRSFREGKAIPATFEFFEDIKKRGIERFNTKRKLKK